MQHYLGCRVKKLNVKIIGELKIRLPNIDKQRIIGEFYRQSLIQNGLMIKQAEDIKNLTITIIRKIVECSDNTLCFQYFRY